MNGIKSCQGCTYHEMGAVFELCTHPSSQYTVASKVDWHTAGHMRTRGGCGEGRALFKLPEPPK